MTTANYSAHDADNSLLPIYFIANEWRLNWVDRITQSMQDAVQAARLAAAINSNLGYLFRHLGDTMNETIDALDQACQKPTCYDLVRDAASAIEAEMSQHINMLNVMILNLRYGMDEADEPENLSIAIDMCRCALGAMTGASVSRRRWFQEHIKAMPF